MGENLRQELEMSEKVLDYQQQITVLKGQLKETERNMKDLKDKLQDLETSQEETLKIEKEKVVQILEAGFVQREKLSVQQTEAELETKHAKAIEEALKDIQETSMNEKELLRESLKKEKDVAIQE